VDETPVSDNLHQHIWPRSWLHAYKAGFNFFPFRKYSSVKLSPTPLWPEQIGKASLLHPGRKYRFEIFLPVEHKRVTYHCNHKSCSIDIV
jgi:hypothetical protein